MSPQSSLAPADGTALEAPSDQSLRVPCYCEENVWRLAYRKLHGASPERLLQYYVVFITNPKNCVPMFQQLASKDISTPCYWDYHVILLDESQDMETTRVLDIDSHLDYFCSLEMYLKYVFPPEFEWPEENMPFFRVVDANVFLETFSSDRLHMYNPVTKEWNAPPPTYECIGSSKSSNLITYMTINCDEINGSAITGREQDSFGAIYSLTELRKRFHASPKVIH